MDVMNIQSTTLTLPATDVKQRFLELLKKVQLYRDFVTITRNGAPAGILMGVDQFDTLMETMEILSDRKIMTSLERSKKQSKKGKLYSDAEVWD